MFEFSKRDSSPKQGDFPSSDEFAPDTAAGVQAQTRQSPPQAGRREAAVIGPSIHINGDLHGDEDLVIEGEVKGTVHLKNNGLTIGSQGRVTADVYAHTVYVDGFMDGDLYGAERVNIRKTAQVTGNITSPRVSLEDGARFKGSIEMDPDAEALQKAFGDKRQTARAGTQAAPVKPAAIGGTMGGETSGKHEEDKVAAAKGGVAR